MRIPLPALCALLCLACSDATSVDNSLDNQADASTDADAAIAADGPNLVGKREEILASLRIDAEATLLDWSRREGWPVKVEGGNLYVTTGELHRIAGDHDNWVGQAMNPEASFHWIVLATGPGDRYKFTDGATWRADSWSRAYAWDDEGEMSLLAPEGSHLERHFAVGGQGMAARTIRVRVSSGPATHVLYVHDGQNLFSPFANFGGWRLTEHFKETMMIVGIDNTSDRFGEYTHVAQGDTGGRGDAYAAYLQEDVRPLIAEIYGEASKVGTMGSSLGGLIALHIADRYPNDYDFAASLSGTLGWGSLDTQGTDTIIRRYREAGHRSTAIYLDSGGGGETCVDADGDGTQDDDPSASDNYCETRQMEATLVDTGYQYEVDLMHWWEPGAGHNEAAWADRAIRPLTMFSGL